MFLFKVEGTFIIPQRGLVLFPGACDKIEFAKPGSKIKLLRPDQSTIETTIMAIEFGGNHAILIGKEIKKEDVPAGTEVLLNE
ncbi:MAG TPA: hypothetical protein VE978_15440 [Chitinophagales bacterium]|nr:hypothetical protein [Chitinophagales bacterium]